jgi:hypothetical protein
MKMTDITLGADPEFFVKRDGDFYPIVGLLGGSKWEPTRVEEMGIFNAYLEDNVMAEYNISPVDNEDDFVLQIQSMIDLIMQKLGEEYVADFSPAARFKPEFLESEQAKVFGCEPDMSAYTLQIQEVSAEEAGNLRTAGGHIHIGWAEASENLEECAAVARAFDLFVTAPMMLIEPDNERRQLYGSAGSMRTKMYGVECRALSSYWQSSEDLMRFVYRQTMKALAFVQENEDIRNAESRLSRDIRRAIDEKQMGNITKMLEALNVVEGVNLQALAPA